MYIIKFSLLVTHDNHGGCSICQTTNILDIKPISMIHPSRGTVCYERSYPRKYYHVVPALDSDTATHALSIINLCESFEADCVVAALRADRNPLSNYYVCTNNHADTSYKVWTIITSVSFHCGKEDVAKQVSDAPTPPQAKELVTKLKTEDY